MTEPTIPAAAAAPSDEPTIPAAAAAPSDERDPVPPRPTAGQAEHRDEPVLLEADLLVEDVSIDGMCGVY
jgi:mycofactocin precursor